MNGRPSRRTQAAEAVAMVGLLVAMTWFPLYILMAAVK